MTMKIVAPGMLQQQMGIPKELQELLSTGKVKFPGVDPGRDEGTAVVYAVAKPGLASGFAIEAQLKHLETKIAKASEEYEKRLQEQCEKFNAACKKAKPVVMPRYTGNNLVAEANIAREMNARDHDKRMEKIRQASDAHDGYFYPTSLSAFVQDHRIMRKGPWK